MDFSVTVTLKKGCFKHNAEHQYDHFVPQISTMYGRLGLQHSSVVELTKASNCHVHSLIHTSGPEYMIRKKLNDYARKDSTVGFICVKTTTDTQGWIDYMSKELVATKYAIGRPPVIKDDFGKFKEDKLETPIENRRSNCNEKASQSPCQR